MPELLDACVDATLHRVGKRLRLATPLGIGKPNPLLNAFYRRAAADPSIDLHIFTALSLARPTARHDLERRLLEPIAARLWGDYPELEYEAARGAGTLPPNVRVFEFYFQAGKFLGNPAAQRDHIASNYTHVVRDVVDRGVNVLAQQVCRGRVGDREALSLGSNPDLSLDLMAALRGRGGPCAVLGQVNQRLPFMLGDAVVDEAGFDALVDDPAAYHAPFATPRTAVSPADHAIGLHASALIKDGGTLQIGIGSLGDALVHALKLRHERNAEYRRLLGELGVLERSGELIERVGGLGPFERGLFASSEMFVDGFRHLIEAGIVKRKVHDDLALMRLLDAGQIGERETPAGGCHTHAAFLLGPEPLYAWLRELPDERRAEIAMRSVLHVNQLSGHEELARLQRRHARFVNTAMMVTLTGAAVSDALEDGRVVSGVGGQYDFVAMAHALPDARSVLQLRSTRRSEGELRSNVVLHYGHATIPRHLRDLVVTEHGIADLRGRSNEEVVQALVGISDPRFRAELASRGKAAGLLREDFAPPPGDPDRVATVLAQLPAFPFGSDLTPVELALQRALTRLKEEGSTPRTALRAVANGARGEDVRAELERMGLWEPKGVRERTYAWLVTAALRADREG